MAECPSVKLFSLPPELLLDLISHLNSDGISRLNRTCRAFHGNDYIRQALWRVPFKRSTILGPGIYNGLGREALIHRLNLFQQALCPANASMILGMVIGPNYPQQSLQKLAASCPNLTNLDLSMIGTSFRPPHLYHFLPEVPCSCLPFPTWSWPELFDLAPALFAQIRELRVNVRAFCDLSQPRTESQSDGARQASLKAFSQLEILTLQDDNRGKLVHDDQWLLADNISQGFDRLKTLNLEHTNKRIPALPLFVHRIRRTHSAVRIRATFNADIEFMITKGFELHQKTFHILRDREGEVSPWLYRQIRDGSINHKDPDLSSNRAAQALTVYKSAPSNICEYLRGLKDLASSGVKLESIDFGQPTSINLQALAELRRAHDGEELFTFMIELTGWKLSFDWYALLRFLVNCEQEPSLREFGDQKTEDTLNRVRDAFKMAAKKGIPICVEVNAGEEPLGEPPFLMGCDDQVVASLYLGEVGDLVEELKITYDDDREALFDTKQENERVQKFAKLEEQYRLEGERLNDYIWARIATMMPNLKYLELCIPERLHDYHNIEGLEDRLPGKSGWERMTLEDTSCRSHGLLKNHLFKRG